MDPDATLANVRQMIFETDLLTARLHLEDLLNWINIGGYVPAGFYEVLDEFNTLERELSKVISGDLC